MASIPSRLAAPASLALHAVLYIVIGWMSFSTAYLQPNAATIWLPSGFALGLLLAKGPAFWPSVTLGSFILNSIASPSFSAAALFAAGAIAVGNTAEGLLGAYLTRRFANGSAFPYRSRSITRFMLLVVPVPPLVSTAIGVSASVWSGIPMTGTIGDVALTWYIANAQGILLFGGLTVLLLSQNASPLKAPGVVEGVVLTLALAFAVQVMTGAFKVDWLQNWPRAYMLIPLVLWASFRFGTLGGLLAVAFITLGSAIGTMQGQCRFRTS